MGNKLAEIQLWQIAAWHQLRVWVPWVLRPTSWPELHVPQGGNRLMDGQTGIARQVYGEFGGQSKEQAVTIA